MKPRLNISQKLRFVWSAQKFKGNSMKFLIISRLVSLVLMIQISALNLHAAVPATPAPPADNSRYVFLPPIDDGGKSSGFHAVTICLPPGYDSTDRRYPVIYVLDGETAFFTRQNGVGATIPYEMVHDQLVHEGLIQPAIFVAVYTGSDASGSKMAPSNRSLDYYPELKTRPMRTRKINSLGEGYFEFLSKKIKPMIDQTYRTRPDPASTGVAGFSASGMGAFWMTYQHPEVFGMGLCQSPDLRFANELLDKHKGTIPPVRLWIDAGSREIGEGHGLLQPAYDVSRALIAQGFRQNDNLGFQIGHDHGHEKLNCTQRMRAALYFLLRLTPPAFTGAEIVEIDSTAKGPIQLDRRGHAVLETEYDGWFRLVDCTASLKVADPSIISLGADVNDLQPRSAGETTLSTSYDGRTITQKLTVSAPMASLRCIQTTKPVTVDGDLSEWPELPIVVEAPRKDTEAEGRTGPSDLSYRFACAHDDKFFYIAIQTTDKIIKSQPDKDPWFQSGVEVRIDARPSSERLFIRGKKEFDDFLLVAMSPSKDGETRLPYNAAKLPEGTQAVCKIIPTGYNTEIAIPFSYLDAKAGGPWKDVRVNVVVNAFHNDYKGAPGAKLWWQPDWRSPDVAWGSGTFER